MKRDRAVLLLLWRLQPGSLKARLRFPGFSGSKLNTMSTLNWLRMLL
jgi:hypothetical protein